MSLHEDLKVSLSVAGLGKRSLNFNQRQTIFLVKIKQNQHIGQTELLHFTSCTSFIRIISFVREITQEKKQTKQANRTLPVAGRSAAMANSTSHKNFPLKLPLEKKEIALAFPKEIPV